MCKEIINTTEVLSSLFNNISALIETTKEKVYHSVNSELVLLYWNIGKTIKEDIIKVEGAGYGEKIVEGLAKDLSEQYGKGYSKRNLFRMVKFYEAFTDFKIVTTLSAQLTWSHFVELISIEDSLKREFYATLCSSERWSVRTLRDRKSSVMYERTAISKKPELTIINDLKLLREE